MPLPPNIESYVKQIDILTSKERFAPEDKHRLALAKLKIALWACATEQIPLTRFALAEILGPDTAFVFTHTKSEMLEIAWESTEDQQMSKRQKESQRQTTPKNRPSNPLVHVYR